MADNVHANLDDLRRLRKAVDQTQKDIQDALKKLSGALNSADWKDRARQDFESRLQTAQGSARAIDAKLNELKPILDRKVRDLENFLR